MTTVSLLSRSASRIVCKVASGFHLLRVVGYSQTKTVPAGQCLKSTPFVIGETETYKIAWCVKYYPNGRDSSTNSDYISLYLQLLNKPHLQVQYKLSILDQAGNVAYGLPAEMGVFGYERGHGGCGSERFIRREDLERREDLLKDDCVVFRCDVGSFTELQTKYLAYEDSNDDNGATDDDDEYGLKPRNASDRRPRRRLPDDNEFVQWCLAQKRMG